MRIYYKQIKFIDSYFRFVDNLKMDHHYNHIRMYTQANDLQRCKWQKSRMIQDMDLGIVHLYKQA